MRDCFKFGAGMAVAMLLNAAPPAGRVTLVVRPDAHTGKLVRSAVVTPRIVPPKPVAPAPEPVENPAPEKKAPAPLPAPGTLREAIDQIAAQHALPSSLLHSVIKVESNYNPYAISPKGAQGLMQLIPSTARRFGVTNVFNPVENIKGGARYLRYLLDYFHGDYPKALAAYNAGELNVVRYGGIPPFSETRNYVIQVGRRLAELQATTPAQAQPAREPERQTVEVKPVEVHNRIHEMVDAGGKIYYVSRQN